VVSIAKKVLRPSYTHGEEAGAGIVGNLFGGCQSRLGSHRV